MGSNISVIAIAVIVGWSELVAPRSDVPASADSTEFDGTAVIPSQLLTARLGSSDLVLVEFADYECPFCGRHATGTFEQIQKELIDTGRVSYAYLHFPIESIHANARRASEAAECALRQGRFWEMHAALFKDRSNLTRLASVAKQVGLDSARFEQCLLGDSSPTIQKHLELGQQLGITGTPTFFLGRESDGVIKPGWTLSGALPFDAFKRLVDRARPTPQWYWPFSAALAFP
jgi:protein-disulfide isomerase